MESTKFNSTISVGTHNAKEMSLITMKVAHNCSRLLTEVIKVHPELTANLESPKICVVQSSKNGRVEIIHENSAEISTIKLEDSSLFCIKPGTHALGCWQGNTLPIVDTLPH